MTEQELLPHLFRTEYSKITVVLCKRFGFEHLEIAEDLASETFLDAVETWPYKGLPENPVAWLYRVAKNKAMNYVARNDIFNSKISPELQFSGMMADNMAIDLSESNIVDSQLQMLFAVCHPVLSTEYQIALALRILCGFGIDEIAGAFLTSKETINKRLLRAKQKLRDVKVKLEIPSESEITSRIESVLLTLYLLFNEGYYSESNESIIREDLCLEAMRLTYLLIENDSTRQSSVYSLLALMCYHASRFRARKNDEGQIVLYENQDATLWNAELIEKGNYYLQQSARDLHISRYHLEARIAYWHTIQEDTSIKWESILKLYNKLLQIHYSPIAALNRTFALSKANGKHAAIKEAEKLQLNSNPYYFTLLAELYTDMDIEKARLNLKKAIELAKTMVEKQQLLDKLNSL